ncbi:ABC transporter permease [Thermocrinis minervae]|uniref:Lipoprotein-releasing system permease protein n=1 Tax=Thermocrinis minervae TaxID=381751 RepID=A0A1M6ST23_9AQUI|nr:ABC transporter permease [Thermocrinis minervae]SHK47806.1 lipoprotein-releasing system permease protein [Thermocrinis minervae]
MKLLLRLAVRFLFGGKSYTHLVTAVAFLGVMIGVVALLLTMGVFSGFQKALKEKILSSMPHVIVSLIEGKPDDHHLTIIRKNPWVERAFPIMVFQAVIGKDRTFQSVSVKAIRPEDMGVYAGAILEGKPGGVMIGSGLADILGVKVGDQITLISPMGIRTPLGFLPKIERVRVGGIYRRGTFDQDYLTVVMPMEQAISIFGDSWQLSGYEVYLKDPYMAQDVKKELEKSLGSSVFVRSWVDFNQPLFNALELEKRGIFFVLLLMILIASFNITSLLFMKAREKVKDVAILKTYGMKSGQVFLLFVLQGFILGFLGASLGVSLAFLGEWLINRYDLIRVPADVYLMDHVPCYIQTQDLVLTFLGALLLSCMSSLLPAYKVSKEKVVQVLRGE